VGYYKGDYYIGMRRGDYYMGDPGFWSTLGGIAKGIVGAIPGVGPIASSVIGGIQSAVRPAVKALPASSAGAGMASNVVGSLKSAAGQAGAIVKAHPVLTAAGGAGILGAAAGAVGGRLSKRGTPMPVGARRRRRMRVTNPKALRRAIRRTHGFAKLAMKTIHLVHPKKKARFGGFRRKRKH
jgi:hypothetical protein